MHPNHLGNVQSPAQRGRPRERAEALRAGSALQQRCRQRAPGDRGPCCCPRCQRTLALLPHPGTPDRKLISPQLSDTRLGQRHHCAPQSRAAAEPLIALSLALVEPLERSKMGMIIQGMVAGG